VRGGAHHLTDLLPTPSPAATTFSQPIRGVAAETTTLSPIRHAAPRIRVVSVVVSATTLSPIRHGAPRLRRHRVGGVVAELADFTNDPTPSDGT